MNVREHETTAALEAIDQIGRENPFCAACGAPNVPVVRDGAIWLQCSSASRKSLLHRVVTLDFGHTEHLVVDEALAA